MTAPAEPAKWLQSVQQAVRKDAGRKLTPALKRWRNTLSADETPLDLEPAVARFLLRFGVLDAGDDSAAQQEAYVRHVRACARGTGDAPGVIGAWLGAFARGEYGVLPDGVCGAEPQCARCPLCESCRYTAAGAREERVSTEDLARKLLDAGAAPATAEAVDLLALLCGEARSGAALRARLAAVLRETGGLRGLLHAAPADLRKAGLNEAAAARMRAAAALFRLWADEQAPRGQSFASGQDFYEHYRLRVRDLKKERFFVACLDQKHRLIGEDQVSEGSLTETLVHPREVFGPALRLGAAAIAVVHNHPSGDPKPSRADRTLTKRLQEAAELIGIRLLDHVIVGDGAFTSFVEEGLL